MTNLFSPPPGRHLGLATGDRAQEEPAARAVQPSFDDLGTPLAEVTFVVVDLETTGGSPTSDAITEIGAVKVRGGEVLGEFGTLVDPGRAIPPMITVLTGITNAMVTAAPRIGEVLPLFLEFARGAVLVAHNARFDVGFLRANARAMELAWPAPQVVDTVALARKVVTKDEAPNHKLATLARLFRTPIAPDHRALTDARATVDVLHALLGRMGPLGVTHLDDLATATDPVPPARRRKVALAEALPTSPGVYQFIGPSGEVLYVGTATSLRRRVRQYFTASEKRRRIGEMVDLAERVHVIECATPLEAHVRELRLIAEHCPAYNRRSKRPERLPWVRLTDEPLPRLSIVRSVPAGVAAIGPFASRLQAQQALEAAGAIGVRACTDRLPALPPAGRSACMLGQIGRCSAPCADADAARAYPQVVRHVERALRSDPGPIAEALGERISQLATAERFEEAATLRDQLFAFLHGLRRRQRLDSLTPAAQLVAARWSAPGEFDRPTGERPGWELVLVRYGRLCGTAFAPVGADPMPIVESLTATAAFVPEPALATAAGVEETELLLSWLERPGVRLIEFDSPAGGWATPIRGAQYWLDRIERGALHGARPGRDAVASPVTA